MKGVHLLLWLTTTASLCSAGAAGKESTELSEGLWEPCDDLRARNTNYAQFYWNPKAFEGIVIGRREISTDTKIEGAGSIHWVVTAEEVAKRREAEPKYWCVALHYLYGGGRNWEHCRELRFHIKCEAPAHPPVYCQLIGTKAPNACILKRGEITGGWKEIYLDLAKMDVGVSPKYGRIMNYFRIWSRGEQFQDGDRLDLYLDNMRLSTDPPIDVTEAYEDQGAGQAVPLD